MTLRGFHLWPRSLAGQMIALLLLALIAAQTVSLVVYFDERRHAVRDAVRTQVLSRMASVVRLLADTPPALSQRVTEAASGPRLRFWLSDQSGVQSARPRDLNNPLQRRLSRQLDGSGAGQVVVRLEERHRRWYQGWRGDHDDDDDDDDHDHDHRDPWKPRRGYHPLSLSIAVALPDGRWLNCQTLVPAPSPAWAWPSFLSMAAMALAITVIVVLSVRRITRPMAALADAAERFGRGQESEPLPERGPDDVRRMTQAFNRMRGRLERFVQDRTRMLAAVSHDLRTPVTSLRLRAEFVEDREIRHKILETLAEMEQMIEAILAFAREDAAREDTRRVDLAALVQSLCDDLSDAGLAVSFANGQRIPYSCRPVALKRALDNLIRNAVTYGEAARVSLEAEPQLVRILVDDDGPGIAPGDHERVFEPFLRLEASRSRDTGGVGLGLAIARSIVRGHGGDIHLSNRAQGGLRATVRLPRGSDKDH